jgi:hypothetical protein
MPVRSTTPDNKKGKKIKENKVEFNEHQQAQFYPIWTCIPYKYFVRCIREAKWVRQWARICENGALQNPPLYGRVASHGQDILWYLLVRFSVIFCIVTEYRVFSVQNGSTKLEHGENHRGGGISSSRGREDEKIKKSRRGTNIT